MCTADWLGSASRGGLLAGPSRHAGRGSVSRPWVFSFLGVQVWLNYKRQSTDGWNMHNVLLDFGGGLLSLVQLLMDGAVTRDWSAVTGGRCCLVGSSLPIS